jgi:hypothetical protein
MRGIGRIKNLVSTQIVAHRKRSVSIAFRTVTGSVMLEAAFGRFEGDANSTKH